jgi:hypothetical protein
MAGTLKSPNPVRESNDKKGRWKESSWRTQRGFPWVLSKRQQLVVFLLEAGHIATPLEWLYLQPSIFYFNWAATSAAKSSPRFSSPSPVLNRT